MGNISGKREILKNEYYFSSIDFENSDDFFAEILRSKLNFLMLATFGCSSSLSNRSPQFDVIILSTRFSSFSRLSSFHFICIATQFWFVSKKEEANGKPCDILLVEAVDFLLKIEEIRWTLMRVRRVFGKENDQKGMFTGFTQ